MLERKVGHCANFVTKSNCWFLTLLLLLFLCLYSPFSQFLSLSASICFLVSAVVEPEQAVLPEHHVWPL